MTNTTYTSFLNDYIWQDIKGLFSTLKMQMNPHSVFFPDIKILLSNKLPYHPRKCYLIEGCVRVRVRVQIALGTKDFLQ